MQNLLSRVRSGASTGQAIGAINAPAGVRFLGEEGQRCVMREFALAAGPCYIGCMLHPFHWGESARQCKEACGETLPPPDEVIGQCMPSED